MTENQEGPGRKRRSGEEIKRLVFEFEASGFATERVFVGITVLACEHLAAPT